MMKIALVVALVPAIAYADAPKELSKLVDAELDWLPRDSDRTKIFTSDAKLLFDEQLFEVSMLPDVMQPPSTGLSVGSPSDLQIVLAADGKSAWISFTTVLTRNFEHGAADADQELRVTEIAVKSAGGWRIAGGLWSSPMANAAVNKAAKAGKLKLSALDTGGDATLRAQVAKLAAGPLDAAAQKRNDLVAIGSGPDERTVGGAVLARAWAAAWAKHLTIDSAAATLAPSGTTGWVLATVRLDKGSYKIPFLICFVFDKTGDGWSLVHVHFAAPYLR